jgi:plasmid stabilization system protein ParE
MKWQVVARPEAEDDILEAARWYDAQQPGPGAEFVDEILAVFDALAEDPLYQLKQHPTKNIRWRYAKRFPYRVVYELVEQEQLVIIAAVLHAARHDPVWHKRF